MAERLTSLMKVSEVQYASGSPLLLEACALYQDTTSGQCIAQLKWKNLDPRPVKAVMIELDGYDAFNQKLEPVNFQYDGLMATQGSDFGSKVPVQIRSSKMVRYDTVLKAVSFSEGDIWRAENVTAYTKLPESLAQTLEGDLLDQYKRDLSAMGIVAAAAHSTQTAMGLWQCGCGSWQLEGTPCLKCRATHDGLREVSDARTLNQHLQEYNEEQERLRIEAARKAEEARIARQKEEEERKKKEEEERLRREQARIEAEKQALIAKKKRNKRLGIAAACVVAAAGVGCAAKFYFIPQAQYNEALKLMEAGNYSAASEKFSALGDYSDAKYRVNQVAANYYFDAGSYDNVGDVYATLPEQYQDHAGDFVTMYNGAVAQMEAGNYDDAITAFTKLGNYSDSKAQITEATYRKACALKAAGDREGAVVLFNNSLNGYKDSKNLIAQMRADMQYENGDYAAAWTAYAALPEAYQTHNSDYAEMYTAAEGLLTGGSFDDAAAAFSALGSYNNSENMVKECSYQKAASLASAGNYDEAATIYDGLNGYSDSKNLSAKTKADKLFADGNYASAYAIYSTLGETYQTHASDYASMYSAAVELQTNGSYAEAETAFTALGKYSDSETQIKQTRYLKAVALAAGGNYDDAIAAFNALGTYSDSASLSKKAAADMLFDSGDLAGAYDIYETLGDGYQTHSADYASIYSAAETARSSNQFDDAYDQFISLGNYSDAKEKAIQCGKDKADGLFAAENYGEAAQVYSFIGDVDNARLSTYKYAAQLSSQGLYLQAVEQYGTIIDYEDSREQRYQNGLKAMQANQLADAYAILAQDVDYSEAKENIYQIGVAASAAHQYEVSVKAFTTVGAYKDSAMNLTMDTYAYGEQLHDAGRYDEAVVVFNSMNGFSNTAEKAQISAYAAAEEALNNGNYEDAVARFTKLGNYSDSATKVKESNFRWAESYFAAGDYETAKTMFAALGNYSTSKTRLKASKYAIAQGKYNAGDYAAAVTGFHEISGYEDAGIQELASRYALYSTYYDAGKYDEAITGFELIAASNYSDSATQAKKSHYAKAQVLDNSDPRAAYDEYVLAGDYSDAQQQVKTHAYNIARGYQEANSYTDAIDWYEIAADYSDAQEQLYKIGSFYFSTQDYTLSVYSFKTLCGYKDASDYLTRIGNYYEMQSDTVNAYLAYGYACPVGMESEKVVALKATLEQKANSLVSSGKLDDAMDLYITLAKIDPAEKANMNSIHFVSFMKKSSALKIGSTKWKYLAYESGKFVFIAETNATSAPWSNSSYGTKKTTVSEWLSSAPSKLFNADEKSHVSVWVMSKSEIEKYMPNKSDRGSGYWCSDRYDSSYSHYYVTNNGSVDYSWSSSTDRDSKGVRPGMKLSYNSDIYQMIISDPSRYKFYSKGGKETTFEPMVVEDGARLPYGYELPKPEAVYTVSDAGASYSFAQNSNGYYVSGNKGRSNSCALCKVTFTTNTGYIYLDCINYAEGTYDYGIISKVDSTLSTSSSADSSSYVFKSFSSSSSNTSSVQTVAIPVNDTNEHTIYVKFIKDGFGNNNNDTLQFKVRFE